MVRRRIALSGTVQGVGFRPFVYRLAREQQLLGSVHNDGGEVIVDVQGAAARLDQFEQRLRREAPPSAQVEQLQVVELDEVLGLEDFLIEASATERSTRCSLAPDIATCARCLAEMKQPADRRFGYPFINCTDCGPRYTIARALPYDRPNTTMATFGLCADCAAEYVDPADRRFHAQPVACPVCGPRVWLASDPLANSSAIAAARQRLVDGDVIAIKGIGGFHLAVNARDAAAIAELRRRKQRPRKPLALMVRDVEVAQQLALLDSDALELLRSPAAPIVVVPARADSPMLPLIAPGLGDLGLMLPYSPLHHLLLQGPLDVLVMTSGNAPSEPITIDNEAATRELPANDHLLHDRPIEVACDDSVLRATPRGPVFIRRARGYVPRALDASFLPSRAILAVGAELKSTLSTLGDNQLVVGRHLGDLDNPAAEAAFDQELARMLRFAELEPEAVACDQHPDMYATQYARRHFDELPLLPIQHHHAHLCSVLAEHEVAPEEPAVGIILDGIGWGEDDTIWGGEILRGSYERFDRVAHLRTVPQPGGDKAAREPHRMAAALLWDGGLADRAVALLPEHDPEELVQVLDICSRRSFSPLASSTGRLFDGIAALLGVAPARQDYEGEAAARLEHLATPAAGQVLGYALPCRDAVLDTRELVNALVADGAAPASVRAARFHAGLADGLVAAALAARQKDEPVVLGGGCFINRLLLDGCIARLEQAGARVLWPRRLPPGDGGLSAGQAAAAACQLPTRC